MKKEIAVLCTEIAVDSKCGYTETPKFYYALAEKYRISLIVPRMSDIYIDEAKTTHPDVNIKSITGSGIVGKKNSFFSYYISLSDDVVMQNNLRAVAGNANLIVCESIYYVPLARKTFPDKIVIYRSIDIEYDKFIWFYKHTVCETDFSAEAFEFEKYCCEAADYIFTLTKEDAERLCHLYGIPENKILGRIPICFTGADLKQNYIPIKKRKRKITKGVFISAAHISDPDEFVRQMRNLPKIEFHIIGNGGFDLKNCSSNVIIHGKVSAEKMAEIINECDFALNISPMTFGMNAKNIEYFSKGIPVLANELGVRGYNVVSGREYFPAEFDTLEEDVRKFCNLNEDERNEIALNAFEHLCDEYNYKNFTHCFDELISAVNEDEPESYYIFGAGEIGKGAALFLNINGLKCLGFVDNSTEKQGEVCCGEKVFSPDTAFNDINSSDKKKLIIAANAKNSNEIIRQAVQKIDAEKLIIYNNYAISLDDMMKNISVDKLRNMRGAK